MSKLESINIHIRNAKIKRDLLKKICYYFAKDYTASLTANKLELSRQTINHYYKIIRQALIHEQDKIILSNIKSTLENDSTIIKYIKINTLPVFYIEYQNKIFFIEDECLTPNSIHHNINSDLKISLIRHKKATGAKILLNKNRKEYLISSYITSNNHEVQNFVCNHLKQFRGVSKDNFITHIKESQFRFNYSENFIFNTLVNTLSL